MALTVLVPIIDDVNGANPFILEFNNDVLEIVDNNLPEPLIDAEIEEVFEIVDNNLP